MVKLTLSVDYMNLFLALKQNDLTSILFDIYVVYR